jgi:hypothetical protein
MCFSQHFSLPDKDTYRAGGLCLPILSRKTWSMADRPSPIIENMRMPSSCKWYRFVVSFQKRE